MGLAAMLKWAALALVILVAVLGAFYEGGRRAEHRAAERHEQARLDAARAERAALERDTRGRQEIAQWKAQAARHQAEVRRLSSAASAAARDVKAVVTAGAALQASGTTDEILAALRARGYHPERCRP